MPVYKDKERGTWYFSLKVKDPFGKWKAIKRRGFATKREAVRAEAEARTKATELATGDVTIDQLYEAFMAASRDRAPGTLRGYSSTYRHWIAPRLGKLKAKTVTPVMIELWLHDLADTDLAKSTITKTKRLLSSIFAYGVRMEYLTRNPVSSIRESAAEPEPDRDNFWTPTEFQTFMTFVDLEQYRVLFQLLFYTGLRMGEALALRWVDLDLDQGSLRVRHNLARTDGQWVLGPPKTRNSFRTVDLQTPLVRLLEDWKASQSDLDGFSDSFYVFGDITPWNHRTVAYYFDSHIQAAGVKRITLHGLRHSHASFLIRKGVNDTLIAERLGHTVAVLRKYYSHVYQDQRKELKTMLSEDFWCQSGATAKPDQSDSKLLN